MIKNILIVIVCLALLSLVWAWWQAFKPAAALMVTTYEECAARYTTKGNPPECVTPDGRVFISPEDYAKFYQ